MLSHWRYCVLWRTFKKKKKKKSCQYGAPSWTHAGSLVSTPWAKISTQGERNESKLTLRRGIASHLTLAAGLPARGLGLLLCLGRQVASYLAGKGPWHAPIPAHRNNKSVHQWVFFGVFFWRSPLLRITVLFRRNDRITPSRAHRRHAGR